MSLEALTAAFKVEGLKPTEKLILVVLANYADEHGTCYPSHKHIAKIVGLKDHKGVQRIIAMFAELGLLEVESRYTEQGGQTSNRYHLKLNPTPHRAETPTPTVERPHNTKDKTKELYTDSFVEFWSEYPRSSDKHGAAKIWKRLHDHDKRAALFGAKRFADVCFTAKTETQFIPHAKTWLNNRRWVEYTEDRKTKTKNMIAG